MGSFFFIFGFVFDKSLDGSHVTFGSAQEAAAEQFHVFPVAGKQSVLVLLLGHGLQQRCGQQRQILFQAIKYMLALAP